MIKKQGEGGERKKKGGNKEGKKDEKRATKEEEKIEGGKSHGFRSFFKDKSRIF